MVNNELKVFFKDVHSYVARLKKDGATESFVFAKLYAHEDHILLALNADLEAFANCDAEVELLSSERYGECKVGIRICDVASYLKAIKAIDILKEKHGLTSSSDEIETFEFEDYLFHEGDESVKVLVYKVEVREFTRVVKNVTSKTITRMVPLTFTQKLIMIGASTKDKDNHKRIRTNFDLLMNKFTQSNVKYRITKKCAKITYKRETLAKLVIAGKKTIKVYLALNPFAYEDNYKIIDASDKTQYQDVPTCIKVTGRVSLHRAYELIEAVMSNYEVPENKKYIPNYPYSKEILVEYKKSLKETANAK